MMKRKNIPRRSGIFWGLVLTFCTAPWLQAQAGEKIGFVDMEKVEKAKFIAAIIADVEKSVEEKRQNIDELQEEYLRLRSEEKRKKSVLSDSESEALRTRLVHLKNSLEEEDHQLQRVLRKAEKERVEPAFGRIMATIRGIGREEGFDLILPGEVVLYGSPAIDITDKVIRRLDREQKVGTSAKAGPPKDSSDRRESSRKTTRAPEPSLTEEDVAPHPEFDEGRK